MFDNKKYKINRITDYSFLDDKKPEELAALYDEIKQRLSELWKEEIESRGNNLPEKMKKILERHESISNYTELMPRLCSRMNTRGGKSRLITGKPNRGKSPAPNATLELTKVAFETTYDVCSDEVEDFNDYPHFWILEDGGKYYHWLKQRTNPDDQTTSLSAQGVTSPGKPDPIPITFASTDTVKLKATFKVTSADPFDSAPQIRITDKTGNMPPYTFNEAAGKTSGEFEVEFTATNQPYKDTIQYFEKFELLFEYSTDGKKWISAGSCITRLYLTWKEPLWDNFKEEYQGQDKQKCSMQVKCNKNGKKKNILETLLWLGCEQAKGLGKNQNSSDKNEEEILDAIFKKFTSLKVERAREIEFAGIGLGYWRGKSAQGTSTVDPDFGDLRSLRYLLREGEACCGEWTRFLQHLLLTQGIDVSDFKNNTIAICTNVYKQLYPYNNKSKNSLVDVADSFNFAVKNAIITGYNSSANEVVTKGDSGGQGNQKAQPVFGDHIWFFFRKKIFYDPSYGKSYDAATSKLKNYCNDNITTIIMTDTTIVYKKIDDYLWADKPF